MTVGKLRQEIIELLAYINHKRQHTHYPQSLFDAIEGKLNDIIKKSNFIELELKPKYKLMDGDPVGTIEKMIEKVKEQN